MECPTTASLRWCTPEELKSRGIGIIDSTLREGEQFANAFFSTEDKIEIARMLDAFGVEYIELTSPCASPQSRDDCAAIAKLGLKSKILTHIRCNLDDAQMAVDTGVDGVDVVIGTSSLLREFGHGKSVEQIIDLARDVVTWLCEQGVEVRFSTEDSLRSNLVDLLQVYREIDKLGVHRVGIADTVGIGSPEQIQSLVSTVKSVVKADIEFHGHNDTGCAIANAYAALCGGARFIDTTVLGIGERNGITPLGGLVSRLYALDTELVAHYELPLLYELDHLVAERVGISVPFNNYITGYSAFMHKAGIHAKADLNNPQTYEILKPADFGLNRYVHVAHRLTGWNAIKDRAQQLNIELNDDQIKEITVAVKRLSDLRSLGLSDVDDLLRSWGSSSQKNKLEELSMAETQGGAS